MVGYQVLQGAAVSLCLAFVKGRPCCPHLLLFTGGVSPYAPAPQLLLLVGIPPAVLRALRLMSRSNSRSTVSTRLPSLGQELMFAVVGKKERSCRRPHKRTLANVQ